MRARKSPSDYASALPESAKQRRTQIENTLLFGSLAGGGSIGAGGSGGGGGDGDDLFDDDGFSASQEDEEEEDDVFGALGGAGEPVDAVAAELLKRRISMENHSLFAALLGPDASPLKDAGAVAVSPPPAAADIVRPRASSETCCRHSGPRGVIEYLRARALDVPGILVQSTPSESERAAKAKAAELTRS